MDNTLFRELSYAQDNQLRHFGSHPNVTVEANRIKRYLYRVKGMDVARDVIIDWLQWQAYRQQYDEDNR